MSKLFDLLDILKELEVLESLIKAQKGTIEFVNSRMQKLTASDDEERLKSMRDASAHDIEILEPYFASQKEKYASLLDLAKTDSKVLSELETIKVSKEYKKSIETLKQDLLAQSGYEKPEE